MEEFLPIIGKRITKRKEEYRKALSAKQDWEAKELWRKDLIKREQIRKGRPLTDDEIIELIEKYKMGYYL